MGYIVFVTGTDTGIGKTVVACALKHGLRAQGIAAEGYKPIESGCSRHKGTLIGEDAKALAGDHSTFLEGIRLEAPLAPSVAARLEKHPPINVQQNAEHIQNLASLCEVLVVEGVGGLMVPLNEKEVVLDLIQAVDPHHLILVAGNRLGVLNHTIADVAILAFLKREVSSIILNQISADPGGLAESTNLAELRHWAGKTVPFPYLPLVSETTLRDAGNNLLGELNIKWK